MERAGLIRAALVASTLALLGTSAEAPEGTSPVQETYRFSRMVEADPIDLTREQPTGGFLVTIRALDLGPEHVVTTDNVLVSVTATVTLSDIAEDPPAATFRLGPELPEEFRDTITLSRALVFGGECENPSQDALCQATFDVAFARDDDGLQDGNVRIDWSFELTSSGEVDSDMAETHQAQEPPWTVDITPQ